MADDCECTIMNNIIDQRSTLGQDLQQCLMNTFVDGMGLNLEKDKQLIH